MYDIKELIDNMKEIAKISTNIELAKLLNISYNTLNTWIKRKKIPQEVILSFCEKYKCSLDYLIYNKNIDTTLFDIQISNEKEANYTTKEEVEEFTFYGVYEALNIKPGSTFRLHKELYVTPAYYLLHKDSITFIALVEIDPFNKEVYLNDFNQRLHLEEFKTINLGLIKV